VSRKGDLLDHLPIQARRQNPTNSGMGPPFPHFPVNGVFLIYLKKNRTNIFLSGTSVGH
jgi:hypothetical protein